MSPLTSGQQSSTVGSSIEQSRLDFWSGSLQRLDDAPSQLGLKSGEPPPVKVFSTAWCPDGTRGYCPTPFSVSRSAKTVLFFRLFALKFKSTYAAYSGHPVPVMNLPSLLLNSR